MNKQLVYFTSIIIALMCYKTYSQQIPHYTQYMYNTNILNPAYAGARADLSLSLLGRSQWVGLEGAPQTYTFSANARAFDGIGLGISAVQDEIGLLRDTNVDLDVSYTIVTSPQSRVALGIKAGYSSFSNNLSQGITPDNEVYQDISGSDINFGAGALYYNERFYVGISIPQMLKTSKHKLGTTPSSGFSENINYFTTAGVVFDVNENVKFRPSTLIKVTTGLPVSVDLNANFLYKERVELGVSYRYDDSVSGMIGFIVNDSFRIGYAYDHTLTDLGNFNSGSHEVILLLDIDFAKRSRWLSNSSCYF